MRTPGTGSIEGELEQIRRELDAVQRELRKRALANPLVTEATRLPDGRVAPPRVTGVSLVPNAGKLTVKWNPANITDPREYEVEVSPNPDMTVSSRFKQGAGSTRFTYDEGSAGTDFYFRVRAVNSAGRIGEFSEIFDSSSFVETLDLSLNAATAINSFRKTGGFTPAEFTAANGRSHFYTYGALNIDFPEEADVEIASTYQFYIDIKDKDTAGARLKMDNVVQQKQQFVQGLADEFRVQGGTIQASVANVPAGLHRFTVELELSDTNNDGENSTCTPDEIELQVFRSKR